MKSLKEITEELQKKYPEIIVKPANRKNRTGYIFKSPDDRATLCSIYCKPNEKCYRVFGYAIKAGPNLLLTVEDEKTKKRFINLFATLYYLCKKLRKQQL